MLITLILFICINLVIARLDKSPKVNNPDSSGLKSKSRLFPKLIPHKDKTFLLEFHTDNNDNCEQMEPVLKRLEEDLNTKVKRINIQRRKEFIALLEAIGFDEGGCR
jgi:thiol-disulfide isomerase/thioredoxin